MEWAAGGPPQVLLLGHYGFKEAVVPAKGMIVLSPPNEINAIPSDRSGRRNVNPTAGSPVWRVVIVVATVIFDDGTTMEQ